ncbi:DNA-directed RNA polymerase II subunit RPB1 [Drosophila sechellia]|nr:DNA-directed RNA polymerase II subunit RPB1 [Drosophila sechellia]
MHFTMSCSVNIGGGRASSKRLRNHLCKHYRAYYDGSSQNVGINSVAWTSERHTQSSAALPSISNSQPANPKSPPKPINMKFFAVLVCFSAVLAIAMATTQTTSPTSTPTTPSSPTTTTYTYTTSPSYPTYTYTTDTTTTKPIKQQLLSLLFNKKSG